MSPLISMKSSHINLKYENFLNCFFRMNKSKSLKELYSLGMYIHINHTKRSYYQNKNEDRTWKVEEWLLLEV